MREILSVNPMTWRISPILIFLTLFGIVIVCYAPTLSTSYGFSDDYPLLMGAVQGPPTFYVATAGGRPTYALLLQSSFTQLHSISGLRYIRLLGVFFTAVLMFYVYRIFVQYGWESLSSFFFVVIMGTLPSFQVYAAWATVSFYPCAMLVAAGGLQLVERACKEGKNKRQWWWAIGAICLMTLALTIHQSSAMFFWVLAAIFLLSTQMVGKELLRRVRWYTGVMVVSLSLGYVIFRIGLWLYGMGPVGEQRASVVTNLWEKISWFVTEPLTNALNGINLFPSYKLAGGVFLWTIGGLALLLRGTAREKVTKSICLLALLPLSYLPNLLVAENWASYRTLGVLTSLVALYVFAALSGYEQLLRRFVAVRLCSIVLGVVALCSAILAARQVSIYFAIPQHQELEFMRRGLAQTDLSRVRSIYVIGSRGNDLLAPAVRYDEFGFPSSAAFWVPKPAVYLLLREMQPQWAHLPIEAVSPHGPVAPPSDALVVDMRNLAATR
jgi:hypothetical protein